MNKSLGVTPEVLSLPRSGGAVQSFSDAFSPDLFTGAGGYDVPLWSPKGPGGVTPRLRLTYATTQGNGTFGMGWSLSTPAIYRRSDRGVPSFDDDQDTLLYNGSEIVAVEPGMYRRHRESSFERFIRTGDGWEIQDSRGKRYYLGTSSDSRVEYNAHGTGRIYAWVIDRESDLFGNEISYQWLRDGGHLYLASAAYGPYEIRFEYEQRNDVICCHRAGFAQKMALRCTAAVYRLTSDPEPVFRRYTCTYRECPYSRLSLLESIQVTGFRDGDQAALPLVRFDYAPFEIKHRYTAMGSSSGMPPPDTAGNPHVEIVDMETRGLPGVAAIDRTSRLYWPNRGDGSWGRPQSIANLPHQLDLAEPGVALADIDGNHTVDIIDFTSGRFAYLPNRQDAGWQKRVPVAKAPAIDPTDPDTRLVDLDGDGRVDLIRSTDAAFYIHFNEGSAGWSDAVKIPRIHDARLFPDVSMGNPRVRFVDFLGDGLLGIALIKGMSIDFWPNVGRGRFGQRSTLALRPHLTPGFDPDRLFFIDINADGISDVVYVEHDRVKLWVNRSGRELAYCGEIRHTPPTDGKNIRIADLDGLGMPGLVWSFPATSRTGRNYKYLAFTAATKPYVMTTIDNGIGLTSHIEYQSSVQAGVAAQQRGDPWATHLPFPIQTVSRIHKTDRVSGAEITREFRYANPVYDTRLREFRGFGKVESRDLGDSSVPTLLTISWFHQGTVTPAGGHDIDTARLLRGRLARKEVREISPGNQTRLLNRESFEHEIRELGQTSDLGPITIVYPSSTRVEVFEGASVPVVSTRKFQYDDYGNVIERQDWWHEGGQTRHTRARFRYAINKNQWLLNLPIEHILYDQDDTAVRFERYHYDGDNFRSLRFGMVSRGRLSRIDALAFTDSAASAVYGNHLPEFRSLGFYRFRAPSGEQGWGVQINRTCFDEQGNPVRVKDAMGRIRSFEYDPHGIHVTAVNNPLNQRFKVATDYRSDSIAQIADPNGQTTRYIYDPLGRLTAFVMPGDSGEFPTQQFRYLTGDFTGTIKPFGTMTQARKEAGTARTIDTVQYVNGFGSVWQKRSTSANGQIRVDGFIRINCRGWKEEQHPPFLSQGLAYIHNEGHSEPYPEYFFYDGSGRVVEVRAGSRPISRTVYHPDSIEQWDRGDLDDRPDEYARVHFATPRIARFDGRGRLLSVRKQGPDGLFLTTQYHWGARGELISATDARNITVAEYTYDLLCRRVKVAHVDAGTRRVVLDANGDAVISIGAEDKTVCVTYDRLRRRRRVVVGGVLEEEYVYDRGTGRNVIGRLARVRDAAGEMTFSYTPRGLPELQTRTIESFDGVKQFNTQFEYDSLDTITRIVHPDGSDVRYTYDDGGLVSAVGDDITAVVRNVRGQTESIVFRNGVSHEFTFDPETTYCTSVKAGSSDGVHLLLDLNYEPLDAYGNPVSVTDGLRSPTGIDLSRVYAFDSLQRVTSASGLVNGVAIDQSYEYDSVGNTIKNTEFSPHPIYLRSGGSNQIVGILEGNQPQDLYRYDQNGNCLRSPGRTCHFDPRGRIVHIDCDNGSRVEYVYSHTGARVRKRVFFADGTLREILYVNASYEVHDGEPRSYILSEGRRMGEHRSHGESYYWHRNPIGSVVMVTDSSGVPVWRKSYWPYGTSALHKGIIDQSQGYIGCDWEEESGLVYCATRYYDPSVGRFLSPDPYFLYHPEKGLTLPSNLNLYAYAANNPVRQADPQGSFWWFIAGGLLIGAAPAANAGIFFGSAGILTPFTGGLVTTVGGILGGSLGFGIGVGRMGKDIWELTWDEFVSLEDEFFFGVVIGAATLTAASVGAVALSGIGLAGGFASIGSGIGITTEGGSALAGGFIGAFQGGVMGAGNNAIISYASTDHPDAGEILKSAAEGFLEGAAKGFATGAFSGLASAAFPSALKSMHIQKEVIDWFSAPASLEIATGNVWSQMRTTVNPFLPEPIAIMLDLVGGLVNPIDKLGEKSLSFEYAAPHWKPASYAAPHWSP